MSTEMVESLQVKIFDNRDEMGKDAALQAAGVIKEAIAKKGFARAVFASAASQSDFLKYLREDKSIDWSKVVAFHQDEWVGVPMDKEYSFAGFIKKYLFDVVKPGTVYYMDGAAENIETECERYGALLSEKPLDLVILGVGENGHIAFNEPHEADFNDPKVIKVITLDEKCRIQQKNDFGFDAIEDVPKQGVTITIPVILGVENVLAVVPTVRKAEAVACALTAPVSEKCPASVLRRKEGAILYLDSDSASQLYPCEKRVGAKAPGR